MSYIAGTHSEQPARRRWWWRLPLWAQILVVAVAAIVVLMIIGSIAYGSSAHSTTPSNQNVIVRNGSLVPSLVTSS
jgi:hypothetical protein